MPIRYGEDIQAGLGGMARTAKAQWRVCRSRSSSRMCLHHLPKSPRLYAEARIALPKAWRSVRVRMADGKAGILRMLGAVMNRTITALVLMALTACGGGGGTTNASPGWNLERHRFH
jgi:hypothetical protein